MNNIIVSDRYWKGKHWRRLTETDMDTETKGNGFLMKGIVANFIVGKEKEAGTKPSSKMETAHEMLE